MTRDNSILNVSCILFDLQNAFNTNECLLYKLEAYGVRSVCVDRFTSYLSEPRQPVLINGEVSEPSLLDCGVPRGFIVGQLLSIILVIEFPNACKNIIPFLFADDANCPFVSIKLKHLIAR